MKRSTASTKGQLDKPTDSTSKNDETSPDLMHVCWVWYLGSKIEEWEVIVEGIS